MVYGLRTLSGDGVAMISRSNTAPSIYPSDHFIYPEDSFALAVDHAVRGSKSLEGRPVILAAKPDCLELEYGWIKPGRFLAWTGKSPVHAVDMFYENRMTLQLVKSEPSAAFGIRWCLRPRDENCGA